jgi:hypothetical protein
MIEVGQTYRDGIGSTRFAVVGLDEWFVYVKRADSPKKDLATTAGAQVVARSEFETQWRPLV